MAAEHHHFSDAMAGASALGASLLEGLPRYRRIQNDVRAKILNGEWKPGDQLPPEPDLAERYGVSRLTVNKALGQLVLERYVFRVHGKGTFVREREASAGLRVHIVSISPETTSPFSGYGDWFIGHGILQGIVQAAQELECEMRFVPWPERGLPAIDRVERGGIVPICGPDEDILELRRRGHVVVQPYYPLAEGLCSNVIADWEGAFYNAAMHLIRLGHSRIALLTGLAEPKSRRRMEGYRRALTESGCFDEALVYGIERDFPAVAEAVRCALQLADPPTAIMASNDLRAVHAVRALRDAGLRVPRDMAVIGYNDGPEAASCVPPLTSCHAPFFECGYEAVKLLQRICDGEVEDPQRVVIPVELHVRESCGFHLRKGDSSAPSRQQEGA